MVKIIHECDIGEVVKIISGTNSYCRETVGLTGRVISEDMYKALLLSGVKEFGDTRYIETAPRFHVITNDDYIITVNSGCIVESVNSENRNLNEGENVMENFRIRDYKVYDNKTVIVEFRGGTKEKAVCSKGDSFDLERGVEICVLKHIFGSEEYKALLKEAMKQIKGVDKKKEAEQSEEELIQRRKAKAARRKARRLEKKREARINEMKEAYVRALKETGSVCDSPCADTLDDLK